MGHLRDLWKVIVGSPQLDLFFAPLPVSQTTDGQPLVPDECYVEFYVESLRLEKARKFATTFHGMIYSFVTLARQGDNNAQLAALSKPDKLAQLDKDSIGKVITVSKQMMAPVAWRGGKLGIELGLFSIKAGNLLSPILDYVTRVSSTAGVSFVGVVKPFLPLITEGLDIIAGQTENSSLEVGLDTDINPTQTATYAIIDAPKDSIKVADLSLDPLDHKLLLKGQSLQRAYCVFSIRRQDQKTDYGEIPSLKEKYAALQAAIRAGKQKEAEDALTAFRLEVIASQDLITNDATRLIGLAEKKVAAAFRGGPISAPSKEAEEEKPLEPLSAIGLYGQGQPND